MIPPASRRGRAVRRRIRAARGVLAGPAARAGLALAALLAALAAAPAAAYVPSAEKLTDAAARANFEADRVGAWRMSVALTTEPPGPGVEPIATGELLSDPGAMRARLDLVGINGVRERQLWSGAGIRVWRDGVAVSGARPLLPPVGLLHVRYGASLRGAARRLGVATDRASMGRAAEHDCFAVGRAEGEGGPGPGPPVLWLDAYTFRVVGVDGPGGVAFRFGPARAFGESRQPAWMSVQAEGTSPLYLEVRGVEPASPRPADFQPPVPPPSAPPAPLPSGP